MAKKVKSFFKKKFTKGMQKKLVLLFGAVILAFVGLVGYITIINAKDGEQYTKIVLDQQQYESRTIPYKRGDILDRNGTKLATSERVYNVILDAKVLLSKDEYLEPTLAALKDCFDIKESDVRKVLDDTPSSRYCVLKKAVDYNTEQKFEKIIADTEKNPNVKGIWMEEDYVRKYPYDTLASGMLGFASSGNVGNSGIEAYYNSVLNGTDGREYGYLDSDAGYEKTVKEAENGKTVVSTIDLQVQSIVEKHILAFNEEHKNLATEGEGSKHTAVMVMNPQNGEILAEASYPNYDLNNPRDLTKYYSKEEIKKMTDDEQSEALNSLWTNFCVSDDYEPGSTFKPFTVAAGLELGVLDGSETFNCTGMMHVGDDDIYCHVKTGHGQETLKQAVENSCNVALMQIAQKIKEEQFSRYQKLFGFGQYTDIDLPGETDTSGLLYQPEDMDPASLATNAFGQNFNVTMTQLAAAYCSLVNGGDYYKPHVVKRIEDENGNVVDSKDSVVLRKTVSKETSDILKEYMLGVVEEGTGTNAAVEGYDIGGKTGTAEKLPRGNEKYLISFIGYAPQDNPQVVVYVVIDEPNAVSQEDSSLVTTLASDIMKEIFPYLGIKKNGKATSSDNSDTTTGTDSADTSSDATTGDGNYYTDGTYDYSYDSTDYSTETGYTDYSTDGSYTDGSYTGDYYTDTYSY